MASAEKLLQDAQYAFQCISFGESPSNKRNAARALSLCRKIIRKYPGTQEESEAHAILRRLGEEAYSSQMALVHRHITQTEHHTPPKRKRQAVVSNPNDTSVLLNWSGLFSTLFALPKAVLAIFAFIGLFLFGIFGPFLFVPLLGLLFLTYPVRQMMKPQQRREMNAFITNANAYIEKQRRTINP